MLRQAPDRPIVDTRREGRFLHRLLRESRTGPAAPTRGPEASRHPDPGSLPRTTGRPTILRAVGEQERQGGHRRPGQTDRARRKRGSPARCTRPPRRNPRDSRGDPEQGLMYRRALDSLPRQSRNGCRLVLALAGDVFSDHDGVNAAANLEVALDARSPRLGGCYQIVEDLVGHGLVEGTLVAVRPQVELPGFQLDAEGVGDVLDLNRREVWLAGLRAQAGELGTFEADDVVPLGIGVGEGFEILDGVRCHGAAAHHSSSRLKATTPRFYSREDRWALPSGPHRGRFKEPSQGSFPAPEDRWALLSGPHRGRFKEPSQGSFPAPEGRWALPSGHHRSLSLNGGLAR